MNSRPGKPRASYWTSLPSHLSVPLAMNLTQMSDWPASNWGTSWHHFKVHVKFNGVTSSGQQMADGEIYIAIDGKVYVDATGLYNRNPENGPIDYIEFGGWAQTDPEPFDVWFDNITISTGGFVSDSSPTAPTNVTAN